DDEDLRGIRHHVPSACEQAGLHLLSPATGPAGGAQPGTFPPFRDGSRGGAPPNRTLEEVLFDRPHPASTHHSGGEPANHLSSGAGHLRRLRLDEFSSGTRASFCADRRHGPPTRRDPTCRRPLELESSTATRTAK